MLRRWRLKKYHGGRDPKLLTSYSSLGQKPQENRPDEPETRAFAQEFDSFIAVARAAFEACPAHPRDPGGDGFLAWAAKRKERLAWLRTRRRKPLLFCLLSSAFLRRALCNLLRHSDFEHI